MAFQASSALIVDIPMWLPIYCCAAVYFQGGWISVGGTSWASPTFAGIVNAAGKQTDVEPE